MAGSITPVTSSPPLDELELLDELEEELEEDDELEEDELEEFELELEELELEELELDELEFELDVEDEPGPPQADKIATELASSVVATKR